MARIHDLGPIGVWSGALRVGDRGAIVEAAAELEELGFGALWMPGREHADLEEHLRALLAGTRRAVVATGIVSIWTHPAGSVAAVHHALQRDYPGRFLLGIGVSHAPAVQSAGQQYQRPMQKLRSYLDELDGASPPLPRDERIVAALGPKALALSAERSLGTHPYFVPPEHTRVARQQLGPGPLIAPEQMVVLETDPAKARAIARQTMARYLALPNYTNNLVRLGYTAEDLANGGSDRLVDAIVAWGDAPTVLKRVAEHHDAGAEHVCVQVLSETPQTLPMDGFRQLAAAMTTRA
jgi:probable F420-dependent oxidoreductase